MNETFLGADVQALRVYAKLDGANLVHLVVDVTLQEEIKTVDVDLEYVFASNNIEEDIFVLSIFLGELVDLQAINLEWCLHNSDQLWYLFFVLIKVPQTQLLLI